MDGPLQVTQPGQHWHRVTMLYAMFISHWNRLNTSPLHCCSVAGFTAGEHGYHPPAWYGAPGGGNINSAARTNQERGGGSRTPTIPPTTTTSSSSSSEQRGPPLPPDWEARQVTTPVPYLPMQQTPAAGWRKIGENQLSRLNTCHKFLSIAADLRPIYFSLCAVVVAGGLQLGVVAARPARGVGALRGRLGPAPHGRPGNNLYSVSF